MHSIAPILTITPEDGSIDFQVEKSLKINFDVPMYSFTGEIVTNEILSHIITLKKDHKYGQDLSFNAVYSASQGYIRVNPSANLHYETYYYLSMGSFLYDQWGNLIIGPESLFKTEVSSNIYSIESNENIKIWPNPSSNDFNLKYNTTVVTASQIIIINQTGKTIYSGFAEMNPGENLITIPAYFWPNGLYFLRLINKQEIILKKIIKQH